MGLCVRCIVLPKVMEQQNKQFNLTCMLCLPWHLYLIFRGLPIQNSFLIKKSCASSSATLIDCLVFHKNVSIFFNLIESALCGILFIILFSQFVIATLSHRL